MHPELVKIIAEKIQNGQIATNSHTPIMFFVTVGVIAIVHGILLCKRVYFISKLKKRT